MSYLDDEGNRREGRRESQQDGGIYLSWGKIVTGVATLFVLAGGLAFQVVRQEVRINNLESQMAQTRSEMIGQRRFEDFSSSNAHEHQLMIQQMDNMQRKVDELMMRTR